MPAARRPHLVVIIQAIVNGCDGLKIVKPHFTLNCRLKLGSPAEIGQGSQAGERAARAGGRPNTEASQQLHGGSRKVDSLAEGQ